MCVKKQRHDTHKENTVIYIREYPARNIRKKYRKKYLHNIFSTETKTQDDVHAALFCFWVIKTSESEGIDGDERFDFYVTLYHTLLSSLFQRSIGG